MRTALCVAAVVVGALAICLIQDGVAAAPAGSVTVDCCENFKTTRIPHKRLVSFTRTVGCSTPSIIFTNRRKMRICTRASEKWVQDAVAFLEKKLGVKEKNPLKAQSFNPLETHGVLD
ncbi:C-C motif chemokine 5-like [Chiloscyllium plagiosum]|uniref:C-C motif chemokine 5-like n=1 Tax=Chiloscyllium plagiosum TaxID=36176 RepID=UPI001CB88443|nr:C-C motif chemokine 5-like [Chiloscyllium plagiosum]